MSDVEKTKGNFFNFEKKVQKEKLYILYESNNNNLCLIFGSLISQQKDKIKWLQFPLPISLNWQVEIFQKYLKLSEVNCIEWKNISQATNKVY